ncbi:conserved protein of unknown function [Tenacibaculum sp. 190524A02b]|uniref:hypothetical protein n=1 Tax=Tenacibaculum vairaonense TaxID=3137860 RepID=UPI0032B25CD4
MNLIEKISNWIKPKSPKAEYDNREFEWCIVGNIVDEHHWGENKEIKRGNKQFRPGAKVYCMPEFGGMAYESIRVLGKPRRQNRLINIIIRTRAIKNFRIQKVYNPYIQNQIGSHFFYWNNRRSENELKNLKEMINYLNTLTEEIN